MHRRRFLSTLAITAFGLLPVLSFPQNIFAQDLEPTKTCRDNSFTDNFDTLKDPWLVYYRSELSDVTADGKLKIVSNEPSGNYTNSGFEKKDSFYSGDVDVSIDVENFSVENMGALDWYFQATAWGNLVLQTNDFDWVQLKIKRDIDGYSVVMQYNLKENARIVASEPLSIDWEEENLGLRLVREGDTIYGLIDNGSGYKILGAVENAFVTPVSIGLGLFQTSDVSHLKNIVYDNFELKCVDSSFQSLIENWNTANEITDGKYISIINSQNLPLYIGGGAAIFIVGLIFGMVFFGRKRI